MTSESSVSRSITLALVLVVSACATTPPPQSADTTGLTPDEVALRQEGAAFVAQNVFEGALVNAVIGCAIGALLVFSATGEGDDALVGCGVGGAAGAVYGGVDGYLAAKRSQAAQNELATIQAMTADLRAENDRLGRLVESSQRVADHDRERIALLKARIDAKEVTLEEARAEAKVVRENSARIEEILIAARARRDNYVEARGKLASADTAPLDTEIVALNGEIAELESQLTLVNSSLQVSGLS